MEPKIKPYARIYSRAEVEAWMRENLGSVVVRTDTREAEACAAQRKEQERARKIAAALSKWKKGVAA